MPESSLNEYKNWPPHGSLSKSCILPETPFSIRLDGTGFKQSEITRNRKLKGLKTQELHELMFKQGVNMAKTPRWQRRGILVYEQPYLKQTQKRMVTRCRINENWSLPLFTEKDGAELIHQILEFSKQKKEI